MALLGFFCEIVTSPSGDVLPGAAVTVKTPSGSLVDLFDWSVSGGFVTKQNPFTAPATGEVAFWAAAGVVDITLLYLGQTGLLRRVVPAQDGMTAQQRAAGAVALVGITAGGTLLKPDGAELVVGSGGTTPNDPPQTPSPADDEFLIDGALDTTGARRTGAVSWQMLAMQGQAGASISKGSLVIHGGNNNYDNDTAFIAQPVSGQNWKRITKITSLNCSNYDGERFGIFMRNSTTGQMIRFCKLTSSGQDAVEYSAWSTINTPSGLYPLTNVFGKNRSFLHPLFLSIGVYNNLCRFAYSDVGVDGSWCEYTFSAGIIGNIDQAGIFISTQNGIEISAVFDFWREA